MSSAHPIQNLPKYVSQSLAGEKQLTEKREKPQLELKENLKLD